MLRFVLPFQQIIAIVEASTTMSSVLRSPVTRGCNSSIRQVGGGACTGARIEDQFIKGLPSFRIMTQHPNIKLDALSPKPGSTKSANFMVRYCRRCWKSAKDAHKICLLIYGSSNGNPSDDNRKEQGDDASFNFCRSCIGGKTENHVTYAISITRNFNINT